MLLTTTFYNCYLVQQTRIKGRLFSSFRKMGSKNSSILLNNSSQVGDVEASNEQSFASQMKDSLDDVRSRMYDVSSQTAKISSDIDELKPLLSMNAPFLANQIIADLEMGIIQKSFRSSKFYQLEVTANQKTGILSLSKVAKQLSNQEEAHLTPDELEFLELWKSFELEIGSDEILIRCLRNYLVMPLEEEKTAIITLVAKALDLYEKQ